MFLPSNLHTGSYLKVPAPATAPQHWMGVAVRAGATPSKQKRAAPASQNWPPSSSVLVQSQYCTCLTKKQRKLRFFFVAAFCIWHRLSSYYCLCNKLIQNSKKLRPSLEIVKHSAFCTYIICLICLICFFVVAAFFIWHRLSSYCCLCNK